MVVIFLTFFIVIIVFLYNHFKIDKNYWSRRNVIGPEPTFFFGNIKDFLFKRKTQGEVHKEIYDKYPNEKVVGFFRMKTPALLVRDIEVIKNITVRDFDSFGDRGLEFDENELGANLFHATGEKWRILKERFTGLFTPAKLKNMMDLMSDRADRFLDYVNQATIVQKEQEVCVPFKNFTQSNICACAFGMDIQSFSTHHEIMNTLDKSIFTYNFYVMLEIMYPGAFKRLGITPYPKTVGELFSKMTEDIIIQRNDKPSERGDFMDLMLELRQEKQVTRQKKDINSPGITVSMTVDMIRAQFFVFFAGGYETSAMTMSFMLYHLAHNPNIQDKAIAEIESELQKNDGKITFEAISNLNYLDQVIDETLRLHPIVEFIRRCASEDCYIPGTDARVEKGQIIFIPINAIHKDKKYFSDPEKFDPERFSVENKASINPGAYFPFGLGLRRCVGKFQNSNKFINMPIAANDCNIRLIFFCTASDM